VSRVWLRRKVLSVSGIKEGTSNIKCDLFVFLYDAIRLFYGFNTVYVMCRLDESRIPIRGERDMAATIITTFKNPVGLYRVGLSAAVTTSSRIFP
jgi:hypothetical protein